MKPAKINLSIGHVTSRNMEIRNIIIGTHQINITCQMNLFFTDEPEHLA